MTNISNKYVFLIKTQTGTKKFFYQGFWKSSKKHMPLTMSLTKLGLCQVFKALTKSLKSLKLIRQAIDNLKWE
jgi:hypothetical protein